MEGTSATVASVESKPDEDVSVSSGHRDDAAETSSPSSNNNNNNNNDLLASHEELWAKTEAQVERIAEDVKESQALCGQKLPLSALFQQYDPHSNFTKGLQYLLQKNYTAVRTVRGDGNCFYRCFLYALCEIVREKNQGDNNDQPAEVSRIVHFVEQSDKFVMEKGGYDEFVIDLFHEALATLLQQCRDVFSKDDLHSALITEQQGDTTSDSCIWYLRVLTATYLKSDPIRFTPFLEGDYLDIDSFCRAEIEPMGKECTMLQVLALAEVFGVAVNIEYLDGHSETGELTKHEFGPAAAAKSILTFLYRPGHYDILYTS